ncbi:MAG TPA: hypothetical protein VGP68_21280 [Gemmataceae bacterium]|jgi:hypothetical protein|nr:hypothetical protein [Gemmataceae bacterium]
MVEERTESREVSFRQFLPWTHIFRSFRIALNPKSLLLAAAGILVMAFGWWLLALIFSGIRKEPVWPTDYMTAEYPTVEGEKISSEDKKWEAFKIDRNCWSLLYEAAGRTPEKLDVSDFAQSPGEFDILKAQVADKKKVLEVNGRTYVIKNRPYGKLCTWPWSEDRGPNPYLLVTGKTGNADLDSTHYVPWERGQFFDWFLGAQVPVLIEPLIKFLRPVFYFLHPNAGYRERLYFLLVILWTVATWAIFGGAITRMAAVSFARNESVGITTALRYTISRWKTYLLASSGPLLLIAGLFLVLVLLVGLVNLVPLVGDFWAALMWPVVIILGVVIAIAMIGLIGWPMIHATLAAQGTDSFDAMGRCYSYVIQDAWNYLWYVLVAVVYGAVVVFFVGLVGSLAVYLGKWGVASMPGTTRFNRDPSYLCVYAPRSFGWRELLLNGSPVVAGKEKWSQSDVNDYVDTFHWWNYVGAFFVSMWLYLFFLMIIGFGYSYFWCASTIIYFLMRCKVDDIELDEVYLEEEDDDSAAAGFAPAAPSPAAPMTGTVQMVEAPSLHKPPPPAPSVPTEPPSSSPGNSSGATPPPPPI